MTHTHKYNITDVRKYLESREDVLFAYLFGSLSKGSPSPLSDVDVAVYLREGDLSDMRLEILGHLMDILKTDHVDLVILNTAPLPLKIRIIRDGTLLVDNEPFARHAFESATIRTFLDFSKIEKQILEKRYLHG
jgi:predicted nucleotidyltransferase